MKSRPSNRINWAVMHVGRVGHRAFVNLEIRNLNGLSKRSRLNCTLPCRHITIQIWETSILSHCPCLYMQTSQKDFISLVSLINAKTNSKSDKPKPIISNVCLLLRRVTRGFWYVVVEANIFTRNSQKLSLVHASYQPNEEYFYQTWQRIQYPGHIVWWKKKTY